MSLNVCVLCAWSAKRTLTEGKFYNQVNRMTHSVDNSELLFSVSLSLPPGLTSKVGVEAGLELMYEPATWASTQQC